jgi:hypothetical protein
MSQEKYIGMDVHQATISVAVMDAQGKLIMECLLETKAVTIVEFMLSINVNPGLLRKGGILECWRPRVFRRMNIYGEGSLEKLIVVVLAGLPKPLKIAESFRPNR